MVRSTAVVHTAVRNNLRRAAALAATGTLAVLATAAPALAQSAPAPAPAVGVVAASGAVPGSGAAHNAQAQLPQSYLPKADAPAPAAQNGPNTPPPCDHHRYYHPGLLSGLLEATGTLLSSLLGALL